MTSQNPAKEHAEGEGQKEEHDHPKNAPTQSEFQSSYLKSIQNHVLVHLHKGSPKRLLYHCKDLTGCL